MKEHMLEAIKRKRSMLEGDHSDSDTDELAPESGSASKDAILGHPGGKNSMKNAESSSEEDNQTAAGKMGFDHEEHGSPENSDNMFHDPKHDTHDPVDLNRHRNMAGDGSNSKYDKMGVDEHKNPRMQSSKMAGANAIKGEGLKNKELNMVKGKLAMSGSKASSGEDAGKDNPDASGDNQMQKGFRAPFSKSNMSGSKSAQWDQDKDGAHGKDGMYADAGNGDGEDDEGSAMGSKLTGMKGARAKLNGFLSKMKNS